MLQCGIVAVGDISNTTDTFLQKQKGNLHYYTFVEYFDLFQENNTDNIIAQYDAVYNSLQVTEKNKIAKVPHAPYSVSRKLFNHLFRHSERSEESVAGISELKDCFVPRNDITISIHNQETLAENELFQSGKGGFIDFYNAIGYATDNIPVTGNSSIHYALEYLQKTSRNLLVHNTLTTKADIEAAEQALGKENTFWATCPNANLYIENRLPDYRNFLESDAQVCIGTDSLTSNWQLSILEEMKTILKYQSYLDFDTVLKWATLNGAAALGFDQSLGSIETGKTPGLVLIEHMEHGCITGRTSSKRIL
jgi:aminodeoxyfutalosine deaminase